MSIVVPVLEDARCLERLGEVLDRTVRAVIGAELIVSDGGSSDDSVAVASGLADAVVVHAEPRRQTIGEGRNCGAAAARGDVLLFLDADVSFSTSPAELLDALVVAARDGAATCRVEVDPAEATWGDRLVLGACNRLFHLLNIIGIGMGRGEVQAVRRDVFEAVGGYDASLAAGEDFDLFHRISRLSRRRKNIRIRFLTTCVLYEDPRRYRKLGYPRTLMRWFFNFLSVWTTGRSWSARWDPVR